MMHSGVFEWSWVSTQSGIHEGYVIAYFFDEVLIGTVSGGAHHFYKQPNWDRLMELHVFNGQAEYRVIYDNIRQVWLERVARDELAETGFAYDETLRIVGNRSECEPFGEGFLKASEAGRCVILPECVRNKGIVVRSYMAFEPLSEDPDELNERCNVADYRFVGFESWKEVSVSAKRQSV